MTIKRTISRKSNKNCYSEGGPNLLTFRGQTPDNNSDFIPYTPEPGTLVQSHVHTESHSYFPAPYLALIGSFETFETQSSRPAFFFWACDASSTFSTAPRGRSHFLSVGQAVPVWIPAGMGHIHRGRLFFLLFSRASPLPQR